MEAIQFSRQDLEDDMLRMKGLPVPDRKKESFIRKWFKNLFGYVTIEEKQGEK